MGGVLPLSGGAALDEDTCCGAVELEAAGGFPSGMGLNADI